MRNSICLLVLCAIFFSLIPSSLQYGIIYADKVVPVKEENVHFTETTSETIRADVLDIGSMTLSDPGGFNLHLPSHIGISSEQELNLNGQLGLSFGGAGTAHVNIASSNHNVQFYSEDYFALFNDVHFTFDTSIEFDTASEAKIFADGNIDLEGYGLSYAHAVNGNLDVSAPSILGTGSNVLISSNDRVSFQSQTGFVDWASEGDIRITGDVITLVSQETTEMVANHNVTIHSEDAIQVTATYADLSGLGDIYLESNTTIDLKSQNGIILRADAMSFHSDEAFMVEFQNQHLSRFVGLSKTRTEVITQNAAFVAKNIQVETFDTQKILANSVSFSSVEDFSLGSEATKNVYFNAGFNYLTFTLQDSTQGTSGDEIDINGRFTTFNTTGDIVVHADREFRSNSGSSIINAGSYTNVTALLGDIIIDAFGGRSTISSESGFTAQAKDDIYLSSFELNISAGDQIILSSQNFAASHTSDLLVRADHLIATSSETSLLSGGRAIVNSQNILFGPVVATRPDISISAFKNIDFWATNNFKIDALSNHFTIENGELLVAAGSLAITGSDLVSISSNDDATYRMHGTLFSTTAQNQDITFSNGTPEDSSFLASTYGDRIDFTATNTFTFNVEEQILFDSGLNILISGLNDVSITSDNLKIQTLSSKTTAGIDFDARDGIITINSVEKTTFDSSNQLILTASAFDFTTPLFQFTGSEELVFSSGDSIFASANEFSVHSDGFVKFSTDTTILTIGNDLIFNSVDSFNVTAGDSMQLFSGGSVTSSSEYFHSKGSEYFFQSNIGDFLASANNAIDIKVLLGAIVHSATQTIDISADSIYYSAKTPSVFASATSISINSGTDTNIIADHINSYINGDWNIDSEGGIAFSTDEFQATFSTTSTALTLSAREEIDVTSEGPLSFSTQSGSFTAHSDTSLTVVSDDAVNFQFAGTVEITNVGSQLIDGELPYIHINSGGSTEFWALNDNLYLNSSDVFTVTAGRIIADSWKSTLFLPDLGGIVVNNNLGSIYYDISSSILLNATNGGAPDTASHHFLSSNGVHWKSLDGGIYFDSQGTLANTNDESFLFSSSGKFGDIFVHSLFGGILLHALNDITYTAANDISLQSAYGGKFTADDDITYQVPAGNFDIQSQRGIVVEAGDGLDSADIIFNQLSGFYHVHAANNIILHSTGPVNDNSILVSGPSDIQFSTGNTGDFNILASKTINFIATGFFTAESTNNMLFNSTAGKISYLAERNIEYTTKNGPIVLSTFTGSQNGNINLVAENGDLTFTSGNSTEFAAVQQTNLRAVNGIEVRERDGSLSIATESADSFIFLTSAGGVQVKTVADLVDPTESASSIYLEAANNIEFGTKNTQTIELNTDENFTVGSFSRPLITLRAGGDAQTDGFIINSDGGIHLDSERTVTTTVGEDTTVSSAEGIFVHAEGPFQLKTTGAASTITFDSKTGIARLNANDYLSIQSQDSITTTTSGGIDIIQIGNDRHDQLLFETIGVDITTDSHTLLASHIDADLTNNFTWQTSGDGLIQASLDVNSHILFSAQTSFTASSLGEVEIATHKDKGVLTFETFKQSDISITTDFESDLSFTAIGEFGYYSSVSIINAAAFSLNAVDLDPNDDYTDGNIQIGAENKITQSSGEDILFSAQRSVTIETIGNEEDIGSPLTIDATGRLSVKSSEDMTIRTIPGEDGSIYFTALTDINIDSTSQNLESFVSFIADNQLNQIAARDYVNLFPLSSFYTSVGEDYTVVANGKDPNSDFGIHIDSVSDIYLYANEGSVSLVAETNAIQVTLQSGYYMSSFGGQYYLAKSAINIDVDSDIELNAEMSDINIESSDGIIISSAAEYYNQAAGVDDSGKFGIRYQADSAAPFILRGDELEIDAYDGLFIDGGYVSLAATNEIEFEFEWANVVFNTDTLLNITGSDFSIYSAQDVKFDSSSFQINAEATIDFLSNSGPIIYQANGPDAWIDWFSSGEFIVTATNINLATELGPGADLRFISSLGRFEFTTTGTPTDTFGNINQDSISFISMAGDLHFDAQGDDADIYATAFNFAFQAAGDFVLDSSYSNTDDLFPGVIINSPSTNTLTSASTINFMVANPAEQNALVLNSATSVNFYANGQDNNPGAGGTISMFLDEIGLRFRTATVSAPNTDSTIYFSSPYADITLRSEGSVNIAIDSKMKIPYNLRVDQCRPGAFFYTDVLMEVQPGFDSPFLFPDVQADGSVGYLCICESANINSIRCIYMREPPCDPRAPGLNGGQCPTNVFL